MTLRADFRSWVWERGTTSSTLNPEPRELHLGVSENWGYHFGGLHNKDYSISGSKLGSPYFGKVPFSVGLGSGYGLIRLRFRGLRPRIQCLMVRV